MTHAVTRDEVLAQNPLILVLERSGVKMRGSGNVRTATKCASRQHKPDHWCVSIDLGKGVWHCNDCGVGGSVVDWVAIEKGVPPTNVFREMAQKAAAQPVNGNHAPTEQVVATYDYTDENSNLLYQVVRYHPKTFRQRQPDNQGGWRWTMDGAMRVPYRLPEVLKAEVVYICEGEKDVESLRKLGLVGTCNVGGAGKWLDAYSELLRGRHIIVIPDNDEPGKKHSQQVLESLNGKALSAKLVPMPAPHKDASDFLDTFADAEKAKTALLALVDKTPHTLKPLPIYTIQELERRYSEMVRRMDLVTYDLGKFLPSLGRAVRKLMPGSLLAILASTGVGKTAILQSMARASAPLATLFFELELPAEDMFERFVQMEIGCYANDIESEYKTLNKPIYQHYKGLSHILVCPESGITTGQIESLIEQSELKFGKKAALVLVDYIGLIRPQGAKSRYEAVSEAAEQLKVIAKRTHTIVVMASQVGRPSEKKHTLEVHLNDGKDSGSIENSAGVVLGAWRPEKDVLIVKVLKNTKGVTGAEIHCKFDGALMRITETPIT